MVPLPTDIPLDGTAAIISELDLVVSVDTSIAHLAGALGAAMFARMLSLGWIARNRDSRVVRITHLGENKIAALAR